MRLPEHIAVIPDGNRRWALSKNMAKDEGYDYGINPGLKVFKLCEKEKIKEVTFYGFTVDNTKRPSYQKEAFTKRKLFGTGGVKVNFLINYGWEWDLYALKSADCNHKHIQPYIHSHDISRIDLVIRWGGRRRFSGLLPVQTVYSDFFVLDNCWPDFKDEDFYKALEWYNNQDVTLGG